ncbi:MAG: hypothetical protein K8T20_07115 [Planctomycetes bacterium]|nr:hypothetical protein [Planctomycetota bacterium]
MNTRALILAVLSSVVLAQPLLLPVLALFRRKGNAVVWFLMSLLPVCALSSIVAGFVAGWEDVFRPAAAVPTGEFAFFPSAVAMFSEVAPVLALCALPTAFFAGLAILNQYDKRREKKRIAAWESHRAVCR